MNFSRERDSDEDISSEEEDDRANDSNVKGKKTKRSNSITLGVRKHLQSEEDKHEVIYKYFVKESL